MKTKIILLLVVGIMFLSLSFFFIYKYYTKQTPTNAPTNAPTNQPNYLSQYSNFLGTWTTANALGASSFTITKASVPTEIIVTFSPTYSENLVVNGINATSKTVGGITISYDPIKNTLILNGNVYTKSTNDLSQYSNFLGTWTTTNALGSSNFTITKAIIPTEIIVTFSPTSSQNLVVDGTIATSKYTGIGSVTISYDPIKNTLIFNGNVYTKVTS
jgi:hypothetical protein